MPSSRSASSEALSQAPGASWSVRSLLPSRSGLGERAGGGSNAAAAPQQAAATCQVLHLDIGAVNLNLQGLIVATQPISIDLSGDSAAPLGNLVCTIQSTLNNVVGLVGLLNQLLGVLTGWSVASPAAWAAASPAAWRANPALWRGRSAVRPAATSSTLS